MRESNRRQGLDQRQRLTAHLSQWNHLPCKYCQNFREVCARAGVKASRRDEVDP
jgi:hypothetical protein